MVEKVFDDEITCLTLHPVTWPNHGPNTEISLASEALGLVSSLDWEIVPGPTQVVRDDDSLSDGAEDDAFDCERSGQGRLKPVQFSYEAVKRQMKAEGIKDGDFVYAPHM